MEAVRLDLDDTAKLLVEKGADVNARDKAGTTALAIAEGSGTISIADCLKQHGAK